MTDIEIARKTKLENIDKIAKKLGIDEENLEIYGKYKAKISDNLYIKNKKDGSVVKSVKQLKSGDNIEIRFNDGSKKAVVK